MGYTLNADGSQKWDGKEGGGFSGNSAPVAGAAPQTAYEKWVGDQTVTNYRFDPNNYQKDANGVRYTPGLSVPITTKAGWNPSGVNPTGSGVVNTNTTDKSNGSTGGGYNTSSYAGGGNSYNPLTATTQQYQPATQILSPLEQLKKAQLAQTMAGLDKSKNASLSNLSAEKATIEPAYQKQKIAADVTAQQGERSFSEYMAQRGGGAGKSGIAGQGTLMNNIAYQGQVGSLNQAEAGAISDNARRVTDIGNAYNSDVAGANSGVEAQYLQNVISQQNADRSFGLQQQQVNNQASQFAQSFGMSQQQFANTINQQGIANAMQDKQFSQSVDQFAQQMGLSKDQYASSLDQWAKSFDQSVSQSNVQNSQWQQTFDTNKTQQQWENEFAQKGYDANQALQMAQLAIQQQNANRSSSGGGGGGGSTGVSGGTTTATANKAAATSEATRQISAAIQGGMTPSQIQSIIKDNSATFTDAGLSISALNAEAYRAYQDYHKNNAGYIPM